MPQTASEHLGVWVLERFQTLTPYKCAIIWLPNGLTKGAVTVAVFMGQDGEDAAKRILTDLLNHAERIGPDPWKS